MISDKILELIHKEIDGDITSAEKDKIHVYLKDNPEAEEQYKQLLMTVNAVEKLENIDPGVELKDHIMNSIEWNDSYSSQKPYDRKLFLPGIIANPRVRQAITFSLGFVFCFLLITVLFKDPFKIQSSDPQLLMGTIGIEQLDAYALIDSVTYESDLGSITVNQNVREKVYLLQASVDRMQNITIEFNYDSSQLAFAGYYPIGQQANRVTTLDRLIRVSSSSSTDYTLLFHSLSDVSAALEIEVSSDHNLLVKKIFIINEN